jgi:hypothetical protein
MHAVLRRLDQRLIDAAIPLPSPSLVIKRLNRRPLQSPDSAFRFLETSQAPRQVMSSESSLYLMPERSHQSLPPSAATDHPLGARARRHVRVATRDDWAG